jgi:hypothetical protein
VFLNQKSLGISLFESLPPGCREVSFHLGLGPLAGVCLPASQIGTGVVRLKVDCLREIHDCSIEITVFLVRSTSHVGHHAKTQPHTEPYPIAQIPHATNHAEDGSDESGGENAVRKGAVKFLRLQPEWKDEPSRQDVDIR